MPTTYPYWDSWNRYIAAGGAGQIAGLAKGPTVLAQIFAHPSGYWQVRCAGSRFDCPEKLGPYFGPIANAQAAIQDHCQSIHYVTPPPSAQAALAAPTLTTTPPALQTTPSKIITTHS